MTPNRGSWPGHLVAPGEKVKRGGSRSRRFARGGRFRGWFSHGAPARPTLRYIYIGLVAVGMGDDGADLVIAFLVLVKPFKDIKPRNSPHPPGPPAKLRGDP